MKNDTGRRHKGVKRGERLSMGWKINKLPTPTPSIDEVKRTLLQVVDRGGELPAGWDIEWHWRNAPHLPFRRDEFAKTVRESARGGFREIMRERIETDFDRIKRRIK